MWIWTKDIYCVITKWMMMDFISFFYFNQKINKHSHILHMHTNKRTNSHYGVTACVSIIY